MGNSVQGVAAGILQYACRWTTALGAWLSLCGAGSLGSELVHGHVCMYPHCTSECACNPTRFLGCRWRRTMLHSGGRATPRACAPRPRPSTKPPPRPPRALKQQEQAQRQGQGRWCGQGRRGHSCHHLRSQQGTEAPNRSSTGLAVRPRPRQGQQRWRPRRRSTCVPPSWSRSCPASWRLVGVGTDTLHPPVTQGAYPLSIWAGAYMKTSFVPMAGKAQQCGEGRNSA